VSRFNVVPPLVDEESGSVIAHVHRPTLVAIHDSVCTVDLTIDEAIALRDWLNKALPVQNKVEQVSVLGEHCEGSK